MTDDNGAAPAPFDMAAIDTAIERMTPEQRAAARVEAESVALGLDAIQLANEYAACGDLGAAARWYAVAVGHGADGAAELLSEVKALIRATVAAGVAEGAGAVTVGMRRALQAMTPEQREQRLVELRRELWRRLEEGELLSVDGQ